MNIKEFAAWVATAAIASFVLGVGAGALYQARFAGALRMHIVTVPEKGQPCVLSVPYQYVTNPAVAYECGVFK